jgi:glycosyltransferase involved in cell wall biosynthesis
MSAPDYPRSVSLVIPVFNGLDVVRSCIQSALAAVQRVPFHILIIDDASDQPELLEYLDSLAASGSITLLRNDTNRGFVNSVNRGLMGSRHRCGAP